MELYGPTKYCLLPLSSQESQKTMLRIVAGLSPSNKMETVCYTGSMTAETAQMGLEGEPAHVGGAGAYPRSLF